MSNEVPININGKATAKVAIIFIAIIVIAGILFSSIQIVEAGHRGVLLHFGAVDLTQPPLTEGLHFVIPVSDQIIPIEVRTLKFVVASSAASKDLQTVTTEITVNYHPNAEFVHTLYKEVGLNYRDRVIAPAVEESVKQVTAKYNAEELITKRQLVKDDIESTITERLSTYHIKTDVISITDFQFSALFSQAIESKVEAEQKALKAENDLLRIEVEARQTVASAIGIAEANIAEAKGEAEAIEIINSALATNPNYLQWLKTQKWDGVLPLVVSDDATPFIQIPTR
ncbi:MAG: prohibitin family protein [Candidatus Nitrosoabyssus spongiisocia]|nr:MAG: prohibitin family protein [Nitrosopumilaceae archaeon AB1(1)]